MLAASKKQKSQVKKKLLKIKLDEKTHTYTDEKGRKYESVNKIIDKFINRFDPDGMIAKRVAQREGVTVKEIKSKWQKIATDSTTRGTKIHKALEEAIANNIVDPNYEDIIYNFFESSPIKGKVYTEEKIYNEEMKIAGTPDIKEEYKGRINIWDFKTNKSIEFFSPYGNRMKYPLDFLEDCSYNRYSLQLSFYAWMLEQHGEKIGRLGLIWINPINDIVIIPIPYMKHTIETILSYLD